MQSNRNCNLKADHISACYQQQIINTYSENIQNALVYFVRLTDDDCMKISEALKISVGSLKLLKSNELKIFSKNWLWRNTPHE